MKPVTVLFKVGKSDLQEGVQVWFKECIVSAGNGTRLCCLGLACNFTTVHLKRRFQKHKA